MDRSERLQATASAYSYWCKEVAGDDPSPIYAFFAGADWDAHVRAEAMVLAWESMRTSLLQNASPDDAQQMMLNWIRICDTIIAGLKENPHEIPSGGKS